MRAPIGATAINTRMPRAAAFLIGLLAALPANAQVEVNDPFEPVNRAVFQFNNVVDGLVLEPAARIYRGVTPVMVRRGVNNIWNNLTEPVIFLNDVLQGQRERAGESLSRFLINSTVGVLGLFDVASVFGYERHREDFGQTLGRYGVEPGPYLVLPILGPSSVRDGAGLAVDVVSNPFFWTLPLDVSLSVTGARIVDTRSEVLDELDELERTSLDFYASIRTIYMQQRISAVSNGAASAEDTLFDEELPD